MIVNFMVQRLQDVIDYPKFDRFKAENFDEIFSQYMELGLENWNNTDGVFINGNMSGFQDRTRTLPHYLKMSGWEPLPEKDTSFDKTFKQITLETAKAIVDRANGQQIAISWSGGLDSTTVLFALLQYADPKQLIVVCNYYSIVESGSVFDRFIRGRGIRYSLNMSVSNPEFADGIIVTGYLGDQLFGKLQSLTPEQFKMNWRVGMSNKQVECMERILENYPATHRVHNRKQFSRFIELNCKWQMGKTNRMRDIKPEIASRMINFYETVDYQKWSLGSYEEWHIDSDPKSYKLPLRKFLTEMMETDYYSSNKVVQTSHFSILNPDWLMLLEDGTNLYIKDFK
jgi:hypothetical protein